MPTDYTQLSLGKVASDSNPPVPDVWNGWPASRVNPSFELIVNSETSLLPALEAKANLLSELTITRLTAPKPFPALPIPPVLNDSTITVARDTPTFMMDLAEFPFHPVFPE